MKKFLALGALFFAIIAIIAGFAAYLDRPARSITFTATNVDTQALRSVVVHITGKAYAIGDIAAGASKSVALEPGADSHVELAFSGHPRLIVDTYFSGGYTGAIAAELTADRVVTVDNALVFGAY